MGLLGPLLLWVALFGAPSAVASEDAAEYEIKAAYLYNFAQFVHWSETRREFPVCVLGDDPFGPALEVLRGEPVGEGMRVVLRYAERAEQIDGCRVVFVGRSRQGVLRESLRSIGRGVLTVADWPGFAAGGGVVELYREGDRVRFAVNIDAAGRSGLSISAELLDLARIVHDGEEAQW